MLRDIHKTHNETRKDRYRTVFCDQDFYIRHQNIFKMWKTRFSELSNVEKLQAWTIALSCLRRPQDWFGGKRSQFFLPANQTPQHSLTLHQIFLDTPILSNAKLTHDLNLSDFINQYRIKALPESCFRSLCFLTTGRYPLIITEEVPTPHQLLKLQIQGKRLVSINEDFESWPHALYADRDFLGFILHDLIHADHFFFEPLHRDGQLGFYLFIENFLNENSLKALLEVSGFKSGFEYIISDMNSHPLHLFQTLHSLLFSNCGDDQKALHIWNEWAAKTILTSDEILSVQAVNSRNFGRENARIIEDLCRRLAHSN